MNGYGSEKLYFFRVGYDFDIHTSLYPSVGWHFAWQQTNICAFTQELPNFQEELAHSEELKVKQKCQFHEVFVVPNKNRLLKIFLIFFPRFFGNQNFAKIHFFGRNFSLMCNVHGVIWYWCQKPTGFPKCARFRSNTIVDNLLFEKFLQILNFLKNKYGKESILPPMYMDYSGHISLETLWGMYSIFFLLLLLRPNDICKWTMSTSFF